MKEQLTQEQQGRLFTLGLTHISTIADLLEVLPPYIDIYRYRPEQRWENMSDPTYEVWLKIEKTLGYEDDDPPMWECRYGDGYGWKNPDMCLSYECEELIDALYELYVAYLTAPDVWVQKERPEYVRHLGEPPIKQEE